MKKRLIEKDLKIGEDSDEYKVLKSGIAEGELVRR